MVQRFYRKIKAVLPQAKVIVATSRDQISSIHDQLGENVGLSVEPCRRDTFPAIALASSYLVDMQGAGLEESVVVCPVDSYVEDEYFCELKTLGDQADKGMSNLILMGIKPDYPSEKYGYIIPEDNCRISRVLDFKEKPDIKKAEEYICQGALWNGGVFACKLGYVLKRAHEIIDFKDYGDLLNKYDILQEISFDHAVVEKESKIQVIRYWGKWKDLGTWNTLSESMEESCVGNVMDKHCSNVHIINELGIPILAVGLKDIVICACQDGILVSDKEQSSSIKSYVERIEG